MSSRPKSRARGRRAASHPHLEHQPSSPPPANPPSLPDPTTSNSISTPISPQISNIAPDLSNLNIASSALAVADAHADAPTPTPKKLVIKLLVRKENPITLAVRIPGLSHTAPKLPESPAKPGEQLICKDNAKGREVEVVQEEKIKAGTICVSELLAEDDIREMPSLEKPLTRKRRRASSVVEGFVQLPAVKPRGRRKKDDGVVAEVLVNGNGTAGSSKGDVLKEEKKGKLKGEKLTNDVNGSTSHKSDKLVEIPNGVEKKKSGKPKDKEKEKEREEVDELKGAQKDGKKEKEKDDREKDLERNIDNVIFGDVTFKAWYPSWYPKEIIGEKALSCEGKGPGITVKELYICRRCFGYSKVLVEWVRHCRCCEREVPGTKIYSHGAEGEAGGWSVWEVDGGVETLFCQNLSLFAKLFLDNKSVFFDVSGFNYFLLVHTSPHTLETQIIGFFSKEKMSWDNNNLACILIFPPWQRKGLGALLMGVSYAIAKREGIMGGPEKPISDLGKKGYKRYWGAEIARWLLGVKDTDRKKGKGMVDVERISKETWIAPDDCLNVLREMGVVEKAGRGKGTVERVRIDKVRVREWVAKERLGLERVVDEDGFAEGYALKEVEVEEDEEVEEEEAEG